MLAVQVAAWVDHVSFHKIDVLKNDNFKLPKLPTPELNLSILDREV